MTVQDRDHGYKQRLERLQVLAHGGKIRAGIHAPQGAAYHGHVPGQALQNITVAAWMEFGTGNIPARSFVGAWFVINQAKLVATYKTQAIRYVTGKGEPVQVFGRVGAFMAGGMKQRIADGIPPPNAPSTIAAKGSSKPLIDTGQLRASIGYSVHIAGLDWLHVDGGPQGKKGSKSKDKLTRLLGR